MSSLTPLLQGPIADAIGRALVHLVWQASLVALLLAGLLAAMRRTSSNARYAVSCAALALTIALPLATGALAFRAGTPAASPGPSRIADAALPTPIAAQVAEPASATLLDALRSMLASLPLDPALPWVVGFWLAGVTLLSARVALALVSARRLADSGIETLPREWTATLARLADAMGIDRAVRILESTRVDVPTVVGWLSPVVLVPASALSGLTPQQLETVLAHELAHIRRHDFAVNFLQTLVETLLFYHPAVWWISNRVRVEREHCCDDAAVELCGDAVGYARALATLEEMRAARVPSPALAATGGSLLERVRRLVGLADDDLGSPRPIAALIVLILVSAAIAIPLAARGGRSGEASGTTIVVDSSRDGASPEIAGVWTDPDAPALALAGAAGEAPEADPLEGVFETSELAAAALEEQRDEIERQLDEIEERRHEIERAVREAVSERDAIERAVQEAMSERSAIEWKIAMALAPAPPAQSVPPVPPVAPVAPVTPRPEARPASPLPPVAPVAPTPLPSPMPRAAIAPLAPAGSGHPVDPDNPTVDDLIILHAAGVDPGYVREMKQAGLDRLTAQQLAMLAAADVDADYARTMQKSIGRKLQWSELFRLRALGVDESDVEELRESGGKVDVDSLTKLHGIGIDPKELARLRADLDSLKSTADLARLHALEVDPAYAAELERAGLGKLSAGQYGMLKSAGVDGDWVKEIRAAGYNDFDAHALVGLSVSGVDGEYLRELAAAGFSGLSAEQIMRLHAAGIGGDELKEWKATKKK